MQRPMLQHLIVWPMFRWQSLALSCARGGSNVQGTSRRPLRVPGSATFGPRSFGRGVRAQWRGKV
eukprot:2148500-Lingulodinium_polyedra.AAC.1